MPAVVNKQWIIQIYYPL